MDRYPLHYSDTIILPIPAERVFQYVDNHINFSSHMNKSSVMMGGGSMTTELDKGKGQEIGSHIVMKGRVLGINLDLDEVIIERNPPYKKVWETVGSPNLVIIGNYRMGIEITPKDGKSELKVFIDYNLPDKTINRWLGYIFGGIYAKWCVKQMLAGVKEYLIET